MQALLTRSAQAHPDDFPKNGFGAKLQNYLDITVASGEMQSSLQLLFGAVGFLLLIACANVANLQMARGTARAHEMAVRVSVGAGRARLFRQLLTESVLLSTVGGALGVLFALGLTRAVVALMPENYVPNEARVTVNGYVLMFSAAVSVLTGILFGLAPALQSSRQNLVESLKDAGRSLASGAGGRTRAVLVVTEIALSVVLLMGASLTVRGFVNLQHLDLGFQSDRVLMVSLQLPPKRYPTYEQRIAFAQRVLDSVSQLAGRAIGSDRQRRSAIRRSAVRLFHRGPTAEECARHLCGTDQRGLSAYPRHRPARRAGNDAARDRARRPGSRYQCDGE